MSRTLLLLIAIVLVCGDACALDEFRDVRCGSDIPKALIGRRISDERVVTTEARHTGLNLKDLGGTELSGRLFLGSWSICGHEFELLSDSRSVIQDVLAFPPHSKGSPQAIGECRSRGETMPETVIAVLDNSGGYNARDPKQATTLLRAMAAWKIDTAHRRFLEVATEGLSCSMAGVITSDGGF